MKHSQIRRAMLVVGVILVAGCGSKSELDLIPLRGEVTYNGQPLTEGTVLYVPETSSSGRQASGAIQSDGSFALTTTQRDDGVMKGEYQIVVHAYAARPREPETREEVEAMAASGELERKHIIPKKYTEPTTSGLTDTVDDSHSGFKQIDLVD
jgi:hypothetical protein